MVSTALIAEVAALVGDPARASMLQAMMDGRALTAGEFAAVAGVAPQTASGHLGRLGQSGLISVTAQGRHRYHRLASPDVARLLESLMLVAASGVRPLPRTGPRDPALRLARACFDHIAGTLGVGIADAFMAQGWIELEDDAGLVTPVGQHALTVLGIDPAQPGEPRRRRTAPLCRPCLDWSERRPHLAGRLGAELFRHGLEHGWLRKRQGSRALSITPLGSKLYRDRFGLEIAISRE